MNCSDLASSKDTKKTKARSTTSRKRRAKARTKRAPATENGKAEAKAGCDPTGKPRVLLGACGSACALKFEHLCRYFTEWAEVKVVVTKSALRFIPQATLAKDVTVYSDEDERNKWDKIDGPMLYMELCAWADIMVIAPLSANVLGMIAGGLCEILLTSIVRAWDYSKPLFVAPSMNNFIWENTFTERHLGEIEKLGIILIPPVRRGNTERAMAAPSTIHSNVKASYDKLKLQQQEKGSTSGQV